VVTFTGKFAFLARKFKIAGSTARPKTVAAIGVH